MSATEDASREKRIPAPVRVVAAMAIALVVSLWAFAPALGGYYYLDDFAFVAIARYTDHPLAYYLSQHFPGGFFYRPSGMLFWWVTVATQLSTVGQYAANWALLAGAAVLLWHVLRALGIAAGVALGATVLFVVHPIAVTTAAWLSNRFDLLAAIGILAAILGALRWSNGSRAAGFGLTALGTALAVTAKELGFITPLALFALARGPWRSRVTAAPFLASSAIAAAVFVVRRALLPGTDSLLYPEGVGAAARRGIAAWLGWLPQFVAFVPDHARLAGAAAAIVFLTIVGAALFVANRARANPSADRQPRASMPAATRLGAAMFATAALVQSPTVAYSTIAMPTSQGFDGEAFFAARFYYVALIGLVLVAAGIVDALLHADDATRERPAGGSPAAGIRAPDRRATRIGAFILVLVACGWAWQSRVQQTAWALESSSINRTIAEAAASAVSTAVSDAPAGSPCRIYLVDTLDAAPRFWPFADTIVKTALGPAESRRVSSCIVATERTPWYQVVHAATRTDPLDPVTPPFHEICLFGKPFPPLRFDSVVFRYLAYPRDGATLPIGPGDHVLRYDARDAHFTDITRAAARGDVTVALRWSRPASNACPADAGAGS